MFSTHPQLEGPRWTCSCSECPRRFCWSRSGSRGTTGTTRWAHSPWHKGLHKPPPRDGEALSKGDVELLHLEQMKQDRHGGRHSLVQYPQPAPNRLTWCHTSTCPWRNLLQNSMGWGFTAKCNTWTVILKIYSGKQRNKRCFKLSVWHLGCSPLYEAGKWREWDNFINRKL